VEPTLFTFRTRAKAVCRAEKELGTAHAGAWEAGETVAALEVGRSAEGLARVRTPRGWVTNKPSILARIDAPAPCGPPLPLPPPVRKMIVPARRANKLYRQVPA
jgi:hypothetical protein